MAGLLEKFCAYNKAMSEPTRVKILKVLWSSGSRPLTVSQVAETLELSQPAATKHLQLLLQSGLLTRTRQGPAVYYRISEQGIKDYKRTVDVMIMGLGRVCVNHFHCESCPRQDNCC